MLGGVLAQDKDIHTETREDLKQVTTLAPTEQEVEDLLFANKIVKHCKSNAIVLARGKQLLAAGVGQTSRVDALKHAIEKAKGFGFQLEGAVMASDAFFPFPDCVEIAGNEGVKAVIQPGGSIKDELSFQYCNEHGIDNGCDRLQTLQTLIFNVKNGLILIHTRNSDGPWHSQYHHYQ